MYIPKFRTTMSAARGGGGFGGKDIGAFARRNRGRFRGRSRGKFADGVKKTSTFNDTNRGTGDGRDRGNFSARNRGSKCKTFDVSSRGILGSDSTGTNATYSPKNYKTKFFTEQLLEKDVGITEYINQGEGFSAVFKARFSDFHVNEIDPENQVAKLTDTSIPAEFKLGRRRQLSRNWGDFPTLSLQKSKRNLRSPMPVPSIAFRRTCGTN